MEAITPQEAKKQQVTSQVVPEQLIETINKELSQNLIGNKATINFNDIAAFFINPDKSKTITELEPLIKRYQKLITPIYENSGWIIDFNSKGIATFQVQRDLE